MRRVAGPQARSDEEQGWWTREEERQSMRPSGPRPKGWPEKGPSAVSHRLEGSTDPVLADAPCIWPFSGQQKSPYLRRSTLDRCVGRSRIYSRESLPDVNARSTGFRERLPDVNARPTGFREWLPDVWAPLPTVNVGLTGFRERLPTVNGRLREVNPAGTELCGAGAKACGAVAKGSGAGTKVNPRGRKGRSMGLSCR